MVDSNINMNDITENTHNNQENIDSIDTNEIVGNIYEQSNEEWCWLIQKLRN